MARTLLIAVVLLLLAPAAAEAATVRVYFTKGEQLASVNRDIPNGAGIVTATVQELLKGPTAAETRAGFGTAIPAGSTLASARIDAANRLAILDFSGTFGSAKKLPDNDAMFREVYGARLAQVVYTVSALTGLDRVRVHVPNQVARTLSREDFERTRYTTPETPEVKSPAPADPRAVQTKLAALGYLPQAAVNGTFDYRTMQAVLAFQAWEGLQRDGVVGPQTSKRLAAAVAPLPLSRAPGRHVEIYRQRGVVLLIDGSKLVRAIHTSTGIGGDDPDLGTPPGTWKIYRKELRSWSVPYKTWLPYASYWNAGWALHGYADVPARPASHGCARLPLIEAKVVYDFVSIGTPVRVI
jgi:putative peptidoglycan binding protein/L,D-transpeptidase-like protein/sporulation and spore germination protein